MNRMLFFIMTIILPHLFYAQERGVDYNAIVEKATLGGKEEDILNAYNFIIKGRTVKYTGIQVIQSVDTVILSFGHLLY